MAAVSSWRDRSMWTSGSASPLLPHIYNHPRTLLGCRAAAAQPSGGGHGDFKKKVVVVGSGWAGLAAAHHLSKQGLRVTVLETACSAEVGINGFWYPYQNIFSLVDELNIRPFTNWTRSAHYSSEGIEVEFPIYQNVPRLPAPLGTFFYTQFSRLPIVDRLTSLRLLAAVIDFDNTDVAWRKYDSMTARELFKDHGCSERLYREIFNPILQVGLFAPGEQCSAAAALGMLYYFVLAHQQNRDLVWCRGTVKEKIFQPWIESMKSDNCEFYDMKGVADFSVDEETGAISEVSCGNEKYSADSVVLAVGISTLQHIIQSSPVLQTRQEFLNVMHLEAIDVVSVRLRLDKKVNIPHASNSSSGIDHSSAWTFFNLNAISDEYKDEPVTIISAVFYKASQLLPLKDDQIVAKSMSYLSNCIKELENCNIQEQEVIKFPKSVTHFFPGSYNYMIRGSTSFPNLFMAGDWITNRHGSWAQEKAYVTGLEAANRVVDFLEEGNFAKIIPVEEEEPHIQALRGLNRSIKEIRAQIPLSEYFL